MRTRIKGIVIKNKTEENKSEKKSVRIEMKQKAMKTHLQLQKLPEATKGL